MGSNEYDGLASAAGVCTTNFCEVIPGSVSKIQAALDSTYRPHRATSMSKDGELNAASRAPIMRYGVVVALLAVVAALWLVSPTEWPWARIAATLIYGYMLSSIAAVFGVLLLLVCQNWCESGPANASLHDEDDMDEAGSGREHNHANTGNAERGQQHVQGQSPAPPTTAAGSASRSQPTTEAGSSRQRQVVSRSHRQDSGSEAIHIAGVVRAANAANVPRRAQTRPMAQTPRQRIGEDTG